MAAAHLDFLEDIVARPPVLLGDTKHGTIALLTLHACMLGHTTQQRDTTLQMHDGAIVGRCSHS